MFTTFTEYQAQSGTSFLPEGINQGLRVLRSGVHRVVFLIDGLFQGPQLIMKITQLGVTILSFFPSLDPSLEVPKQFCKEAKNFINLIKGLKSVDGILNFQFSWKMIILNVSGMTFLILSSITIIERFRLRDVSAIKVSLAAIPVFGVLPFGGLFPLSMFGLMSTTFLLSLDKKKKLERQEDYIKNEKLPFWANPLDLNKIHEQQARFKAKIAELREEVSVYVELIKEGKQMEEELSLYGDQIRKIKVCRQAIDELASILDGKQSILNKSDKIDSQWSILEREWEHLDPQELEDFRQAKEAKWKAQLDKIAYKKRSIHFSQIGNSIVISRQVFVIGAVIFGYGAVALPLLINCGLEVVGSGCSISNFFMKRSIRKIEIPSVDLAKYVNLHAYQLSKISSILL